jgi:hypothetical protein
MAKAVISKVPKNKTIDGKKYVLYDTQYTEENAELSANIIKSRVPKSDPKIFRYKFPRNEQYRYLIYVRERID